MDISNVFKKVKIVVLCAAMLAPTVILADEEEEDFGMPVDVVLGPGSGEFSQVAPGVYYFPFSGNYTYDGSVPGAYETYLSIIS
ncbi:MAG: hypothetical protein K5Q00_06170, partial [Gammaproteobacteria bacterium]|nr:hypothetical protein [Gammaproteobacteria bacterium]